MRKLLFILALLAVTSCKKDSDPAPSNDLTVDLVGVYQYQYSETYFEKVTVDYTIEWTITKATDNKISLKHREFEKVTAPGYEDLYSPNDPFEITFSDIEVTKPDRFFLERTADWPTDSESMKRAKVAFDAILVGHELDVKSKATILSSGEVIEDQVRFTKQ